mgnify:CR=1 FL=1
MAAQVSHARMTDDSNRALMGRGVPGIALPKAHHMIPILSGEDVLAAGTKVISSANLKATDIPVVSSLTANPVYVSARAAGSFTVTGTGTGAFTFIVMRPSAPTV